MKGKLGLLGRRKRIPSEFANVYQRCYRLSKECIPSTPVRQRGVKRSAVSKRSQLESKLDDLLSLLRTQNITQNIDPVSQTNSASTPSSIEYANPVNSLLTSSNPSHSSQPSVHNPDVSSQFSYTSSTSMIIDGSPTLTDHGLSDFRIDHLRYLPFIHIPETMAVAQLRLVRPLTCLAVQAICFKVHPDQNELCRQVRKMLAERILVDGERSLDLLLSLLVLMAW